MAPHRLVLCGALIAQLLAMPAAFAAPRVGCVEIPAGTLADSLAALGRQTGISVATVVPGVARTRILAVRGCMDPETALRRMLASSDLVAVRVRPTAFRIVKRDPPRPAALPRAGIQPSPGTAETNAGPDIVVTAGKQRSPVELYPGSAQILPFDALGLPIAASRGTQALVAATPTLSSTDLGPGRNKLFLRGIADSSFTGGSQATVGQYLGEVRLNYAAPDPDLALYDIDHAEILQGPQGTLYGTGSLGGTVRLIPKAPVEGSWEGSLQTAMGATWHASATADIAGVINIPIADGVAARAVGYAGRAPGYIDNGMRRDTNASRRYGVRFSTVKQLGGDWAVEAGGAFQSIRNSDAQYTDAGDDSLVRSSTFAQPSRNRFALGQVTVRKGQTESPEFVAAVALVNNQLTARFDATGIPSNDLQTVDRYDRARLITGEVRMSRANAAGTGWVAGLHSTLSVNTRYNVPRPQSDAQPFWAVRNRVLDTAIFGQATVALTEQLQVTGGARMALVLLKGAQLFPQDDLNHGPFSFVDRAKLAFAPGAAATWKFHPTLTGYARYQRGFRVGGYQVVPSFDTSDGQPYVLTFASDMLDMVETGLRLGRASAGFHGRIGLSAAWWRNLQADFTGPQGPYTSNVGNGSVQGLEIAAGWSTPSGFDLSSGAFLAHSRVDSYTDLNADYAGQSLPNVPALTARVSTARRFMLGYAKPLTLRADLRYVGRSYLGVGPELRVPQGNYFETGLGGEYRAGGRLFFVDVRNLFDAKGNSFAGGNPLTAGDLDQHTPLRPRTVRIGITTPF